MPNSEWYILGTGALVLVCQLAVTLKFASALRRLRPLEDRVAQLGDAMGILTEAAEAGFRATVTEIERLGGRVPRSGGAVTLGHVAVAARSAQDPNVVTTGAPSSESETGLRLSLATHGQAAEQAPPPKAARARRKKPTEQREWATQVGAASVAAPSAE